MSNDDGASILDELDSRLDDFFAEDDFIEEDEFSEADQPDEVSVGTDSAPETVQESETKTDSAKNDNPLDSLKAVVLEMDWEINDENLTRYLDEIDKLKEQYIKDRPLYLFLKLHSSIGKYMIRKKAGAHPEALKFLYNVYNSLEKAMTGGLTVSAKNLLILDEVDNFKNLKSKLFPNLYKPVEKTSALKGKKPSPKLDLSDLPKNVQNDISSYIEDAIASKIEALKKDLE